MNVVLILIDSLNRDALNAYGASEIRTPTFDRFAAQSTRFDAHFVGSLPCMPARREIFTGRTDMLWRPWGPLETFDDRLPAMLRDRGYRTAIVTDHYHYWEEAANGYLQGFESTSLIRGHELDNWRPMTERLEDAPAWIREIERWRPGFGMRYLANVRDFASEEDYFPAKVFRSASEWIERYDGSDPFYLHVESFDVHEPFDVPEPYRSMYAASGSDRDRGGFNVWPPYQDREVQDAYLAQASDEELAYLRAQYAGKLTMVDRWLGSFLDTLETKGLLDDTLVVLTTDHGHDLGHRGHFGKQWPHVDSHARIPLFVRHPARPAAATTDALTSTVDLHATLLDAAGGPDVSRDGRSLLPLAAGTEARPRELHLYGTFGQGVAVTDGRWTLFKSPSSDNRPLFSYSTMAFRSLTEDTSRAPVDQGRYLDDVAYPLWKTPVDVVPRSTEDALYDRETDPGQTRNLWDERPEERDRLLSAMRERMTRDGTPAEQFERLGL